MFSENQIKFISDGLLAMSQVFIGSLIVEYFIRGSSLFSLILGMTMTFFCWGIGLHINRKVNH
jgi:hypothetical protein